jgi:hypothetical protein
MTVMTSEGMTSEAMTAHDTAVAIPDDRRSPWPPPTPGQALPPPRPPREPGLDRSDLRPRPLLSRMLWVLVGTILLLGGVWWGVFSIVGLLARDQWTVPYIQPAEGLTTLRVVNDNGRVVVRGADTDEITVTAEVSRGLFRTDETARVVDDTYALSSDCVGFNDYWCWVHYDIVVPRDLTVVVESDNGRVSVSNLDATVNVDADNGRVELDALRGPILASSDNGSIVGTGLSAESVEVGTDNGRVDLAFTEAPSTVIATTDNGSVEVAVPDLASGYFVDPHTDNGSETISVVQNPSSRRTIRIETDNGSITVRPVD